MLAPLRSSVSLLAARVSPDMRPPRRGRHRTTRRATRMFESAHERWDLSRAGPGSPRCRRTGGDGPSAPGVYAAVTVGGEPGDRKARPSARGPGHPDDDAAL